MPKKNAEEVTRWFVRYNNTFRISLIVSILALTVSQYVQKVNYVKFKDYSQMRYDSLNVKYNEVVRINSELIAENIGNNRLLDKIPEPIWVKAKVGDRFIMQFCNLAFEKEYLEPHGISRYDYFGKTDFAIFPYESAAVFYQGDSMVANSPAVMSRKERFKTIGGVSIREKVIKWRDVIVEDTLIYGMINRY